MVIEGRLPLRPFMSVRGRSRALLPAPATSSALVVRVKPPPPITTSLGLLGRWILGGGRLAHPRRVDHLASAKSVQRVAVDVGAHVETVGAVVSGIVVHGISPN